MMNAELSNALRTNEIVSAMLVLDRRGLPTDKDRAKAVEGMLMGTNLLESAFYPITGLLLVEGFSDQVKRLVDSHYVSTATLINA
jgi:hypothetical protein